DKGQSAAATATPARNRRTHPRANHFYSRSVEAIPGIPEASAKKIRDAARQDRGAGVFRAVHADADQFCDGRVATGRRPDEPAGGVVEPEERRIADRYGADARSNAAGWNRNTAQLVGRGGICGGAAGNSGDQRG